MVLETERGAPDEVADDLFATQLSMAAPGLRFVALNLCEGAKGASNDLFSGLAQSLIARGIPAVVGMRFAVSDAAAATFSPALFKHLCRNNWIDEGCIQGRLAMAQNKVQIAIEWSTPVLFLHRDFGFGWLFKVPAVDFTDPLKNYQQALV